MPANLAAFAIHVDDVDRARAFYEAVFGWVFEPWGPPVSISFTPATRPLRAYRG